MCCPSKWTAFYSATSIEQSCSHGRKVRDLVTAHDRRRAFCCAARLFWSGPSAGRGHGISVRDEPLARSPARSLPFVPLVRPVEKVSGDCVIVVRFSSRSAEVSACWRIVAFLFFPCRLYRTSRAALALAGQFAAGQVSARGRFEWRVTSRAAPIQRQDEDAKQDEEEERRGFFRVVY